MCIRDSNIVYLGLVGSLVITLLISRVIFTNPAPVWVSPLFIVPIIIPIVSTIVKTPPPRSILVIIIIISIVIIIIVVLIMAMTIVIKIIIIVKIVIIIIIFSGRRWSLFLSPLFVFGLSYGLLAVSYTHLDVYKRQDKTCPQTSGIEILWEFCHPSLR